MNTEEILFRCHKLGSIMTNDRSGKAMGETAKKYLVEVYINEKYNRKKDISNRYTEKGLAVEDLSIDLYAKHTKSIYLFKNEKYFQNEFIKGTPDVVDEDLVIDFKSSWDIFTFHNAKLEKTNKDYYWQLQGYMALTGAAKAKLIYCLIDTPETILNSEKYKLSYSIGAGSLYEEAVEELERLHRYGDIPVEERIHEIEIERNDKDIELLYSRVGEARQWIKENLLTNLITA